MAQIYIPFPLRSHSRITEQSAGPTDTVASSLIVSVSEHFHIFLAILMCWNLLLIRIFCNYWFMNYWLVNKTKREVAVFQQGLSKSGCYAHVASDQLTKRKFHSCYAHTPFKCSCRPKEYRVQALENGLTTKAVATVRDVAFSSVFHEQTR